MNRFLIIRFSSLGDIILTLPVIRNIRKNNPNAEIIYLTKKKFLDILKKNSNINRVVEYENIFSTIKKLRKEKFDVIIDLHCVLRSFLIRLFLKAPKKIHYKKDSIHRGLFVRFKIPSPRLEKHVVEKYLETLKEIGYKIYTKDLFIDDIKLKEIENIEAKKIIIFQTAFLGDLILTLPLIKEIKEKFKDSKLTIVVRKEFSSAFQGLKEIDEIIEDDKKKNKIRSTISLIKKIRNEDFDIAILPHRSFRTAIIACLGKAKIRIGFDIPIVSFFYTHKVPFKWLMHDAERNTALLSYILKNIKIDFPNIETDYDLSPKIDEKKIILINPSSVWETKKWPHYKYSLLIKKIYEKYKIRPVIIGSKEEVPYSELIEKPVKGMCINLCGKTSLSLLISLMKKADILITNDSGPMHIGVASRIYVIAIFGPTTKELGFFPYSSKSTVLEADLECRPCRLHGSMKCPHGHFLCMKLISVDDVMNIVSKYLII